MITLASGLSYCDLNFLGTPRVIATVVLHGPGGVALLDPGPTSTLPALRTALGEAGIALRDVREIVLTHVHLDHAGVVGTLVHELPHLRVYVHEKGAQNIVEPERLLASARRLFGADMDRLWGEVRPVPHEALVVLSGSERISAGGRDLEVLYTPGHASHHVSYFSADTGIAFVGDTAGVRLNPDGYILPATPPPDIDLEIWRTSLAAINEWRAETLFITHFGPHSPAGAYLTQLADRIELVSGLVKTSLAREGTDDDREAWFADEIRVRLRRQVGERDAHAYEVAGRFDLNWRGLARYWRKRP